MELVDLSLSRKQANEKMPDMLGEKIREEVVNFVKDFKTSWLNLGRHLYSVYEDKKFETWGFKDFEDYVQKELGIKKSLALKLIKTYGFVEEDEPTYLQDDFMGEREALKVPGYDEINVLRLAKGRKELNKDDYAALRKAVFDKGKDAAEVRKELTALIKERKQVDPDEERERRNSAAIRKLLQSLKMFKKDMETLKLIEPELVDEASKLMNRLEKEIL